MVITENGASFSDGVSTDGRIHDVRRIEYLAGHIQQVEQVIDEGIAVDGYFVWSFLDNLEWTSGFDQRFGLVHVDHGSQRRLLKDSALWYRDHIMARVANRHG
jgi:beta-glucosidase